MMRPIMLLAILCFSILTAGELVLRTQWLSDSELRELLLPPPGCSAPCFLGIRLGVTTVQLAIEMLQADPMISSVTVTSFGRYNAQIIEAVALFQQGTVLFVLHARSGIIDRVTLSDTSIELKHLLLSLGSPAQLSLDHAMSLEFVTYIGFYPDDQIYIQVDLPFCNSNAEGFWKQPRNVLVTILSAVQYAEATSSLASSGSNSEGWRHALYVMKRVHCHSVQ